MHCAMYIGKWYTYIKLENLKYNDAACFDNSFWFVIYIEKCMKGKKNDYLHISVITGAK